jgi:predicted RNase H-like HicB family nuclease
MAGKRQVEVGLTVLFFKEGSTFVAYAPALDLSTCGDSFEEARRRFSEAADLYLEECLKRGTLEEALTSYGWRKTTRPTRGWVPPATVGHAEIPVHVPA